MLISNRPDGKGAAPLPNSVSANLAANVKRRDHQCAVAFRTPGCILEMKAPVRARSIWD